MRDIIGLRSSPRVGGRLAGVLFVCSGVLSAATLPLPQPDGVDRQLVLVLSGIAVLVGGIAFVIPWHRLDARASLVLLPIAFALIAAGNLYGNAQPYTYSTFFIVAFVWVGLSQPRWTSLWFLPLATAGFITPILIRPTPIDVGMSAAALVMPVCVFVAESIAWVVARDRRSREQVSALASVATALGPHLDLQAVCDTLTRETRVALRAELSSFLRLDEGVVESIYVDGFGDDLLPSVEQMRGTPSDGWPRIDELRRGEPVVVEDTERADQPLRGLRRAGIRSYLAVPVMVGSRLAGVLTAAERSKPRRYDTHEVGLARALASHASAALQNALLYEQTLEASRHDSLTGLGNRRAFHERLESEIERASRHERSLSLIVLDVDHLKYVNDASGHIAGDRLLERLASLLRQCSRSEDGVYRTGGDEFALILPESGSRGATVAAERIRRRVERGRLSMEGEHHLTVSIGVSTFPEHGILPDELFERADTALYEVKWSGRNAVATASSHELAGPGVRFGVNVRRIIEHGALVALYQPILHMRSDAVVGYETFCRLDPAYGDATTRTLFRAAASLGLAESLDGCCRRIVLDSARMLPEGQSLFLNVSPVALESEDFDAELLGAQISEAGLNTCQVVIEVTEQDRTAAQPPLVSNLEALRRAGLALAMDDFGQRPADLDLFAAVGFDYVKVDIGAVHTGEADDARCRRLRSLLLVAADAGARAVAEGVETKEDLDLVSGLGFEAAQGYFFKAPSPALWRPATPASRRAD